jgi:uncharacterized repeat protein (TIGR03847 family)
VSGSFELDGPDHFTTGAVGEPGDRVFYLQAREGPRLVTLKVEKEQVRALAQYLGGLLARLPAAAGQVPDDVDLLEPIEPEWAIGSIGVGYDETRDRIVIETSELQEEETEDEPASARFRITRGQAAAFVQRAEELMRAGRPLCPLCTRPMDAAGHVCPRKNGHVARPT